MGVFLGGWWGGGVGVYCQWVLPRGKTLPQVSDVMKIFPRLFPMMFMCCCERFSGQLKLS